MQLSLSRSSSSSSSRCGFLGIVAVVAAVFATVVPSASAAYDVGCLYPEKASKDLFQARRDIVFPMSAQLVGVETPMVIRGSHIYTIGMAACVAYHTPGMKDPITQQPTRFTVPKFAQNPYSMMMCIAQYTLHIADDPVFHKNRLRNNHGYDVMLPSEMMDLKEAIDKCPADATSCGGGCWDMCRKFVEADYDPYFIGHYLGFTMKNYYDTDGWNSEGDLRYSKTDGDVVPCTGNCRTYQPTTNYTPVADPRSYEPYDEATKYECTGDCRRWQPLQEGDEYGNLVEQEFVVPHIGKMATTYLREPSLTLADPMYDLYEDSLKVIEEVKYTSSDQVRKDAITLFDNKLQVRRLIQDKVLEQFGDSRDISFQRYIMYLAGISSAEYDGVVQAWHEKAHHDLVRPTTVIKYWDDDMLETFGGDREMNGPVEIKARDFEAFIRVMPHAEFPSGSSCLCKTYQEFTDLFLTDLYNRTVVDFTDAYSREYPDMAELLHVCGQSRIWGGMHYPEAVPAGEQICEGLGALAVDWYKTVENGKIDELDNLWYSNDTLPVCME